MDWGEAASGSELQICPNNLGLNDLFALSVWVVANHVWIGFILERLGVFLRRRGKEPSVGRSNHGEGGAVTRSYANNAAQSSRPLQVLDGGVRSSR